MNSGTAPPEFTPGNVVFHGANDTATNESEDYSNALTRSRFICGIVTTILHNRLFFAMCNDTLGV